MTALPPHTPPTPPPSSPRRAPRPAYPAAAPQAAQSRPGSAPSRAPRPPSRFAKEPGDRLSKRVAEMVPCSRSEAEQYIAGGYVSVNGVVVEIPGFHVVDQQITIANNATLAPVLPVTLLLHKPPGFDAMEGDKLAMQLLTLAHKFAADRSGTRTVTRHLLNQACVTPLETGASGLLVYTQDFRIHRKLLEDAARVEHEVMVDVTGEVSPEALDHLNRTPVVDGRAMLPAKVSVSHDTGPVTGLRFAVKGCHPGQIAQMCEKVNLRVVGMKRIRVGRVQLTGLPLGEWRYLLGYERF